MQTSLRHSIILTIAFALVVPLLVLGDLDVRVADGTDVAMLIDFDAIRGSGVAICQMAEMAIADSVRGRVFSEKTGNDMKDFGRWFAKNVEDANILPTNIHWVLCGLRGVENYVSDRQSFTQQVWAVAVAVDECDWVRIGDVVNGNGLQWQKDTIFGHRVFNAVKKRGNVTTHSVRCVPGGNKMAYLGYGASKEWECYNANAPQDARFLNMGHLADKEVIRIWLASDKPLSKLAKRDYKGLYPDGAEQIADCIRSFKLSLFLTGQSTSAELRIVCADDADAKKLAMSYLAQKTPEGIKNMSDRLDAAWNGNDTCLKDTLLSLKKGIIEGLEVSRDGTEVVVKTGDFETRSLFMVLVGHIGSLADFFGSFFK